MDSVTQAVLGAAVGEAVVGRRIGNKAIVLGAVFGTLPDLDVVISPFVDSVGFLVHHRAWSHSLFAVALMSPVLALLFRRVGSLGFARWLHFFFWVFLTHVLLDCCTTYGTQILWPFSDRRVAWNNIFIIDPLYTLPLLVGVGVSLFLRREARWRRRVNVAGLVLSTIYMGFAFAVKHHVEGVFASSLERQEKTYSRMMTCPTPLNTVLWYAVAEDADGYYVGTYSLLDKSDDVWFDRVMRNNGLLGALTSERLVERLKWFANDYYTVEAGDQGMMMHVMKFGRFELEDGKVAYPFAFAIRRNHEGNVEVEPLEFARGTNVSDMVERLWSRVLGRDSD